jgi:hypothetical protein
MIHGDKKTRTENFPILKRSDHSPKRDEFIDVSLDPSYFLLDSPFKPNNVWLIQTNEWPLQITG